MRRLTIVQWAGDYREAYLRLAAGGPETYYAQRYSVAEVGRWAASRSVASICCFTERPYDEVLPNQVRAIGLGMRRRLDVEALLSALAQCEPEGIILRSAVGPVLRYAIAQELPTLVTLAESLDPQGDEFIELLNDPVVDAVAGYLPLALPRLRERGVRTQKLTAWGWPCYWTPEDHAPKTAPAGDPPELVYAGSLVRDKGVADAIDAVARLRGRGVATRLRILGAGPDERWLRRRARRLIRAGVVTFGGTRPPREVLKRMRAADVVLIPSRATYPEGLPLVLDHSLCARTPAVVSRHPAFAAELEHRHDAMLFPPADAERLANCVAELLGDPPLYGAISAAAGETWRRLQAQCEWGELIDAWLDGRLSARG